MDLRPLVYGGITLDVCLECCGLWFDAQELERLLELPGPIFHASRLKYTGSELTGRLCPACGATICAQEVRPGGSVFDRCPDCGGLWLDFNAIRLLCWELVGPDEDDAETIERLRGQVRRILSSAHGASSDRRGEQTRQALKALQRAGGFAAADSTAPTVWQLLRQWATLQERDAASPEGDTALSTLGSLAKDAAWSIAEGFVCFPLGVLIMLRGLFETAGLDRDRAPSRCGDQDLPDGDARRRRLQM